MEIESGLLDGDPPDVAPQLLNKILVSRGVVARIVEVEAYWGQHDPASHAFRGMTPRNATMFAGPGLLYVYRSYGIHWCANVVLKEPGEAAAVLLRAIEPIEGFEVLAERRPRVARQFDLTNGPGKLCAGLGITFDDDGTDLLSPYSAVRLMSDGREPPPNPLITTRVGITRAIEKPWRFAVPDNKWVSRGRPATPSAEPELSSPAAAPESANPAARTESTSPAAAPESGNSAAPNRSTNRPAPEGESQ
ncbi:MAG: DNA-3-methyladenine glycosylase [Microthrixaceae bacterium]